MENTIRSHAFFVGNVISEIDERKLNNTAWENVVEDKKLYDDFLCSYFHKSHVDAMIQAVGQERPKFLKHVRQYSKKIDKIIPLSIFDEKTGELKVFDDYILNIVNLHIYCFPLGITLYAIEVNDSGSGLNDLTLAHSIIRELPSRWKQFNSEFKEVLAPIMELLPSGNQIFTRGNKLKLFQILLVDEKNWTEGHLYEAGCCIPIDSVDSDNHFAPSKKYYESIMNENTVAPFKTWKSLSLVDTYTSMFKSPKVFDEASWLREKITWTNSYYRFIFLRVLVQKTFLSTQNVQYRLDNSNSNIIRDLGLMERYYFYDNISYNFLPDLINKQIEKGMAINEEKSELSQLIKEMASKNTNTLTAILSVFAIFSICLDIFNIARMIICRSQSWVVLSVLSFISTLCIIAIIIRLIKSK